MASFKSSITSDLVIFKPCCLLNQSSASPIEIKASFEKTYWSLDSTLLTNKKELVSSTLRSIALNYIERKCSRQPIALSTAIKQLKQRNDIIITKQNKGSGVVVMDKVDYICLLNEETINDTAKFVDISEERRKDAYQSSTIHS